MFYLVYSVKQCLARNRLTGYAVLCGAAPELFQQKKLTVMHDFLRSADSGSFTEKNIVLFPHGVHELLLESVLNGLFDAAAEENDGEVLLYFCAKTNADLQAELSDSCVAGVQAVRLGADEIRKDVIAWYADLAKKLEIGFRVVYENDAELVSEKRLGYVQDDRTERIC